jgi:hypothetical protein
LVEIRQRFLRTVMVDLKNGLKGETAYEEDTSDRWGCQSKEG